MHTWPTASTLLLHLLCLRGALPTLFCVHVPCLQHGFPQGPPPTQPVLGHVHQCQRPGTGCGSSAPGRGPRCRGKASSDLVYHSTLTVARNWSVKRSAEFLTKAGRPDTCSVVVCECVQPSAGTVCVDFLQRPIIVQARNS